MFRLAGVCGVEPWGFSLRELVWMSEGAIDGLAAGIGKAFAGGEDQKPKGPKIPRGHKIVDFHTFKAAAMRQTHVRERR